MPSSTAQRSLARLNNEIEDAENYARLLQVRYNNKDPSVSFDRLSRAFNTVETLKARRRNLTHHITSKFL